MKKRLLIGLWGGVLIVALFLFVYPFLPPLFYQEHTAVTALGSSQEEIVAAYLQMKKTSGLEAITGVPTLIIPKIGVQIPVIESANARYAWSRGVWRQGSTPEQGSNTILSAHRFRYAPPHQRTFYLLDKLKEGDMFSVVWNEKEYIYRVREQKVVAPSAVEILASSKNPIITLVTCHPLFSTAQRLVVIGELVGVHEG